MSHDSPHETFFFRDPALQRMFDRHVAYVDEHLLPLIRELSGHTASEETLAGIRERHISFSLNKLREVADRETEHE